MLVLRYLASFYHYVNYEVSDPRVNGWFLMGTPWPGATILGLYLMFVLKWGPKWMENKKPFRIDRIIKYYNLAQVVICTFLFVEGFRLGYLRGYSFLCQPVDYSPTEVPTMIARRCYYYFLVKVLDLLDTIFFVLRKKQNQVSFLHVYHHTGMVMLIWSGVKWFPGGHGVFMGFINSFVHVVMYFYYFLTSVSPKYKGNLWWKKYITQLQIIQFGMIFLQWFVLLFQPNCTFPKWPLFVILPQNLFMFCLFLDFYYQAYMKKRPASKPRAAKATESGTQNGVQPPESCGRPLEKATTDSGSGQCIERGKTKVVTS
ncbi:elongation of very long chain fatty acids protein 7-like [Anopheles cruzii]|uniref:elongation of very long chain fatty acids protein 7-like n=1 Tax=Anopheles cruzii TaxID=68878 RepID=UPI0022EC6375|nr:elongation of very long chain fatty acids protein 7-like [Anopheles cruzii]